MKWYISWQYSDGEYSHEGDTVLEAFDLRTAALVGVWQCIDALPSDAKELENFQVVPYDGLK